MTQDDVKEVNNLIEQYASDAKYGVAHVPAHAHTGVDSQKISYNNLTDIPSTVGTVTSVSVASANGLAGTVATATTTPVITLSTSITGILKGNGTAISAASTDTDYTTPTGVETLTNKRVTKRVLEYSSNSATAIALNTDNYDVMNITGQTNTIAGFTVTGTPVDGDMFRFSITGSTTTITWNGGTNIFEASTVGLPTATVGTARLDIGFIWNVVSQKWRCVAVS